MYQIQLDNFEGPIDLLLYFIRRDELDIYDIPISKITKEFVETVEEWEKMHLHVAGDFIVMASTLMRIKAKLLLPRPELDDDGEIIDPRTELVRQLVEYKRYKNAAEILNNLSNDQSQRFTRQLEPLMVVDESDVEENLILDVTLFDLARFFKSAMDSMPVVSQFELNREPVKLEEQKKFIFKHFDGDGKLKFSTILSKLETRMEIVVTFLAILDLVRDGSCKLIQEKVFGDLELQKIDGIQN
jgi:segregation and condensation protein A